jgi:hypothetical protein
MKRWLALILTVLTTGVAAKAPELNSDGSPRFNSNFEEAEPWQELEIEMPAFPKQENLIEFYVSAVATNNYFIDASTLAVGADGVVRYTLVVETSGGARNISFEGIHCKERNWKHYATGRSDGTWVKSRASRIDWRPIENKPVNRHHAALSRDLFCPLGNPIFTADEGRNALRLGKHPNSN